MGKYIHTYTSQSEFEADYWGENYFEPWLSMVSATIPPHYTITGMSQGQETSYDVCKLFSIEQPDGQNNTVTTAFFPWDCILEVTITNIDAETGIVTAGENNEWQCQSIVTDIDGKPLFMCQMQTESIAAFGLSSVVSPSVGDTITLGIVKVGLFLGVGTTFSVGDVMQSMQGGGEFQITEIVSETTQKDSLPIYNRKDEDVSLVVEMQENGTIFVDGYSGGEA